MAPLDAFYCPQCDLYLRARGGRCARCGEILEPALSAREDGDARPPTFDAPRRTRRALLREEGKGSIGEGLWVSLVLHVVGQAIIYSLAGGDSYGITLLFIGISQLVYMVPAMITFALCNRPRTVGGLGIAIGITFGLNALCFGVVCAGMS